MRREAVSNGGIDLHARGMRFERRIQKKIVNTIKKSIYIFCVYFRILITIIIWRKSQKFQQLLEKNLFNDKMIISGESPKSILRGLIPFDEVSFQFLEQCPAKLVLSRNDIEWGVRPTENALSRNIKRSSLWAQKAVNAGSLSW